MSGMAWYIPSFYGDFRLESEGDASVLVIENATLGERELLVKFFALAAKKRWMPRMPSRPEVVWDEKMMLEVKAPISKAAPALVRLVKPRDRTLTAVKFAGGKVETVGSAELGVLERVAERAEKSGAKAAASVRRPTPSCPQCQPGEVGPAGEVLREFLTPEQHEDWAQHRAIVVPGGLTGYKYLIAHRNTPAAARIGRICYDMDNRCVVHFHDRMVPPEEEVLAAMLILGGPEEAWLRNEATMLGGRPGIHRFKNPFGNGLDGVADAAFTSAIGMFAQAVAKGLAG